MVKQKNDKRTTSSRLRAKNKHNKKHEKKNVLFAKMNKDKQII